MKKFGGCKIGFLIRYGVRMTDKLSTSSLGEWYRFTFRTEDPTFVLIEDRDTPLVFLFIYLDKGYINTMVFSV